MIKRAILIATFLLSFNFLYAQENYANNETEEVTTYGYNIVNDTSFDKTGILANYSDFIIYYPSGNSLDFSLLLSPYSNTISKGLGLNYTFNPSEKFSFYLGFLYNFPLEGYNNFNLNSGLNFSFGKKINFQPGLSLTLISHSQRFEKVRKTFRFYQIDTSPFLTVSFGDITSLNLQFTKSRYTIDIKSLKNKGDYKFIAILYKYPNLTGALNNFVDNSFSITLNQYIFNFLNLEIGLTKINYLLNEQGGTYLLISPHFYITKKWEITPAINFSKSDDSINKSFELTISYYWEK